jgi:hypothetical protein
MDADVTPLPRLGIAIFLGELVGGAAAGDVDASLTPSPLIEVPASA